MASKKSKIPARVADTVGLLMFLVGSGIILAGEYTEYFKWVADEHGGLQFVRRYMDYPFYDMLGRFVPERKDPTFILGTGALIHGLISVFYGLIGYLLARVFVR